MFNVAIENTTLKQMCKPKELDSLSTLKFSPSVYIFRQLSLTFGEQLKTHNCTSLKCVTLMKNSCAYVLPHVLFSIIAVNI